MPNASKNVYRKDRIRRLESLSASETRSRLGEREWLTFERLCSLQGLGLQICDCADDRLVIDAGCGDQYIRKSTEARGFRYLGIDANDLDFEVDAWGFADASAEVVISLAVLEHLRSPTVFLSETYRVLKPGGLVFFSTPNWKYSYRNFYDDPTHLHPYTSKSVERIFQVHGFEAVSSFPGARCKPIWYYKGRLRFAKCYWLLPFRGNIAVAPEFLKGRATSLFVLARKPK